MTILEMENKLKEMQASGKLYDFDEEFFLQMIVFMPNDMEYFEEFLKLYLSTLNEKGCERACAAFLKIVDTVV